MRQQFLAQKMEEARELDADVVSVLHIAPKCNVRFRRITSPELARAYPTLSATEMWSSLVTAPQRFQSVNTEELFGRLTASNVPAMSQWLTYIKSRYPWAWQPVVQKPASL
jgi:hypothetical protein